jgi:hypothetical protein
MSLVRHDPTNTGKMPAIAVKGGPDEVPIVVLPGILGITPDTDVGPFINAIRMAFGNNQPIFFYDRENMEPSNLEGEAKSILDAMEYERGKNNQLPYVLICYSYACLQAVPLAQLLKEQNPNAELIVCMIDNPSYEPLFNYYLKNLPQAFADIAVVISYAAIKAV